MTIASIRVDEVQRHPGLRVDILWGFVMDSRGKGWGPACRGST